MIGLLQKRRAAARLDHLVDDRAVDAVLPRADASVGLLEIFHGGIPWRRHRRGAERTTELIQTIRSAAKKLTGFERRQFEAEVALKYCDGNPRKTETMFGWSRNSVNTGLCELRTGLRCLDAFMLRGRKKSEEICPRLVEEIRQIVELIGQDNPKAPSMPARTRITVQKVHEELLKIDPDPQRLPSRQTIGRLIRRLGYRLPRAKAKRF